MEIKRARIHFFVTVAALGSLIGSFSNDVGDGIEDVKIAIGLY